MTSELEEIVILYEAENMYFIPAQVFSQIFVKDSSNDHLVGFIKDYEWHIYSGGCESYLQHAMLLHGRSTWRPGDWSDNPYKLVGIYELSISSIWRPW